MASFHLKQEEILRRGKSFTEFLTSGKYKDAVFIDSKNGKTKEYRFTKKTLMRKILSLKAKWEKIEEIKKKKQKKLGVDNFDDDALLYIQGALARAKDDTLSGGGSFEQAVWRCASAFLNSIVEYFKKKLLRGGGIIQSLKKSLRWFWTNFSFYIMLGFLSGIVWVCVR